MTDRPSIQATRRTALMAAAGAALAGAAPAPAAGPLLARKIPSSGQAIPIIGLGTWQAFDIAPGMPAWAEARSALQAFVDGGGTLVDSSPMYGQAEAAIGGLAKELGIGKRLFLATKVWTRGREQGVAQMQASEAKLGRRVEMMQVHNLLDVDTHLATLAEWKAAMRIRYAGVTHYNEGAYDALEPVLKRHTMDVLQINYSAGETSAEQRILPLAQERGLAVLVNRPFAGGDLFARLRRLPLPGWAAEIGCASWGQILLKFALSHPATTCAIPRTRNPLHMMDNLGAARGPMPDAAQRARILAAVREA